ncbi:hypothetical protein LRP31_10030 [Mesorhizobium mediterraneum]|uniref:hypothetical protein n=1 Tax=Mesorhizobium TaxID=68287 RepID=UPI001FD9C6CB|nr:MULTISPECIES: hypothetical protein [Mesorhizobium]WIW55506.1 hypothetical protein LRP31_10030 [Mesorhizobium mediterraneum]
MVLAEVDFKIAAIRLYFPMFSAWMGKSDPFTPGSVRPQQFRSARIGQKLLRHVARIASNGG